MRAVRIVNVLNHKLLHRETEEKIATFDFATDTWISLKKNYYLIQRVAKERIKDEVCKVFSS
jgi:plasmid maintenance system antidote protein VapI